MHRVFLFALLLPVIGCHEAHRFKITGRVTLDGQPLRAAAIEFAPEKGESLFTTTDEEGNYALNGALQQPHATTAYLVRVTTAGEMLNAVGTSIVVPERVPACYNEQSELKLEITSGNNRHDLPLVSGQRVGLPQE